MSLTKVSYSMIQGALINVLDYGAKGDGVTDDTAAMQAAIAAATANGQSTLYIPTGTYIVKQQLNVSQCSVLGEGVYASIIKAGSGYTGNNLMYVGSLAQNLVYENFQLNGNTGTASVKGILIEGNVLHCRFSTIKISNCSDIALYIKNGDSGTTRPSVNTFIDLRIITNDYIGLYYTSGRQNTFINCDFEELGEQGIVCDGSGNPTDAPQLSTFEECWVERVGLNHTTSGGVNAVTLNTADSIMFRNCFIDGYGSNPASTGHGIELLDSLFCTIQSPSIGFNRSGVATSASAPIRIQGGLRHRLIQLPSNINSNNISVYAPSNDYVIKSAYSPSANSGNQIFVANASSIAGGSGVVVQPSTGLVFASNNAARMPVASRFTLSRIWAEATTLPGPVGLLYTITVRKNGVNTGLAVSLSDANGASASTVYEVSFEPGDFFGVLVDTSSGAVTIPAGGLHIALAYMER
jgi:hypothetical protein